MQGPWSGDVPNGWQIRPLWSEFRRGKTLGDGSEELLSVYRDYGVIPKSSREDNFNKPSEDLTKYQRVSVGDLVVNKMKAWQGSLGISNHDGIVSPAYFVYKATGTFEQRFAHYLLRSKDYADHMAAISSGIRPNQWDLDPAQFAVTPLLVPPPAEQRAIADYLDRETAQIDAFIGKNEELVTFLTERRSAAVNAPFAGEKPNARLSHACEAVVDCPHTTPEVDDEGAFEAVRTASVRDGVYVPGQGLSVSEATWRSRNGALGPRRGDVLFTREAPAGEACMVPSAEICLGQRMVLLRIDPARAVGQFLLWQLYSREVQSYFELAANGSTVTNIRLPLLRAAPIWLPSLDEQRRVTTVIGAQVSAIDDAIGIARRGIELARERRAALISAAVTGKVDVGVAV